MAEPASGPSRREREAARHRAEILAVAESLFSEKGYFQTTMEEVARAAEFAVGSLYKFFKSKDDLYAAVLTENANDIEPIARRALDEASSPFEAIERYMRTRFEIFWSKPCFFRLFYEEALGSLLGSGTGVAPELVSRYEAFVQYVGRFFGRAMDAGQFRRMNPELAAFLLEGHLRGYLTYISRDLSRPRDVADEDAAIALFLGSMQP